MKNISDYLQSKLRKDPAFKERYAIIQQKARIGKIIIKYRNEKDLTQADLANELGVSQQYISKIEDGEFSNLSTVEHILRHIGYRLKLDVERVRRSRSVRHRATA